VLFKFLSPACRANMSRRNSMKAEAQRRLVVQSGFYPAFRVSGVFRG
jgi:hypothetical protein